MVSSTVIDGSLPLDDPRLGPSSRNVRFEAMLTLAETASLSRSVTVSVRLIRLSVTMLTASFGLAALGWVSARTWSRLTSPAPSTLTTNAAVPAASGVATPDPTRPTIVSPTLYR